MAKFNKQTLDNWTAMASKWLADHGLVIEQVVTGSDAWALASRCGILQEAYQDRSVVDAHIQTALQSILPNVVFKDRKVY